MSQNKTTLTQVLESIKNFLQKSNQLLGPTIERSIQDTPIDKDVAPESSKQHERPISKTPITFAYDKKLKDSPKLDKATQQLSEDVLAISRRPEDKPKR